MTDRFDKAEQLRQSILDFVNANPGTNTRSVAEKFCTSTEYAYEVMRIMCRLGELEKSGEYRTMSYRATAIKTRTAAEMREIHKTGWMRRDSHKEKREVKQEKPKTEPWRYVNHPDKPIPNQGGQGAVRRQVGIQASAGML